MNDSKGWAVVGKISAILGVVWLIIQIAGVFRVDGAVIEATGTIQESRIPLMPELQRFEYDLGAESMSAVIDSALADSDSTFNSIDRWALASRLASQFRKRYPGVVVRELLSASDRFDIHLTNTGSREARNVSVRTHGTSVYEIERPGQDPATGVTRGILELGDLRPGQEQSVTLWSALIRREDLLVIHSEGTARISFARSVTGLPALLDRNMGFLMVLVIWTVAMMVVYVGARVLTPLLLEKSEDGKHEEAET